MSRSLSAYAALALAFLHAPLAVLILFSFNSSRFTVWEGFSLRWYHAAAQDPQLSDGLVNSVIVAIVAALLSTVIGTCAAYGIWRRADRVLSGSLVSFPGHARDRYRRFAAGALSGGLPLSSSLRLGWWTVIIAHVAFSIAYVAIVISARLRSYDRSLEEAAMDLGGRRMARLHPRHAARARARHRRGGTTCARRELRRLRHYEPRRGCGFADAANGHLCDGAPRRQPRRQRRLRSDCGRVRRDHCRVAKAAAAMRRRSFLAAAIGATACARDTRPRLNVFNWSTYIDPAMLPRFEREQGVRVVYATYESNEEMAG